MNEKGRPGDFLSDGTFSREKMPRYLPRLNRRAHLVMLLLLSALTDLGAQSSTPVPSISLPGSQSTFTGSEPEGKATPEVLQLGYEEAVERGLRNNLGLLLSGDQTILARGERWKELSNLLPNVTARIQEDVQTLSLTALGLKSNVFPFPTPRVIGPFNYFDARASVTQSVFNFRDIEKERAASENLKSAQYTYKDARELVVLAVGNAYLLAIATGARIETTDAQVYQ